jgi:hypothetical protein
VALLIVGIGLLNFADAPWAHAIGRSSDGRAELLHGPAVTVGIAEIDEASRRGVLDLSDLDAGIAELRTSRDRCRRRRSASAEPIPAPPR